MARVAAGWTLQARWRRPPQRGLTFQLADPFFHLLAGLKVTTYFSGDEDLVAGTWVAGLSGGPLLDLENAEVPEFDAAFFHQASTMASNVFWTISFVLQLRQPDFV